MRASRALTVLSATSLAAAGLTGCSSGTATVDPTAPPASSATTTPGDQPSGTPADEPTASGVEITAENIVDVLTSRMAEAGSVHMEMTSDPGGVELEGDMEYTGSLPDAHLTMQLPNLGEFDVLVVDGVTYVNAGAMTQDKYFAYEADDPENPFADVTDGYDPTGTMRGLSDAITSVTGPRERRTPDGVVVRGYQVVVDTAKLDGQQFGENAASLPDSITYLYWVDEDGYLYRVEMDVLGTEVSVTYTDWGGDFDLQPPAAAEITDVAPF